MSKELEALEELRYRITHFNGEFSRYNYIFTTLEDALLVMNLIQRDPQELGFVIQAVDYKDYLQTYKDAKIALNDVVYVEDEFNILRNYFRRR